VKWEQLMPWLEEHQVEFFLAVFGLLTIVGLGSC
jgi:hypothetical protein